MPLQSPSLSQAGFKNDAGLMVCVDADMTVFWVLGIFKLFLFLLFLPPFSYHLKLYFPSDCMHL